MSLPQATTGSATCRLRVPGGTSHIGPSPGAPYLQPSAGLPRGALLVTWRSQPR